MENYCGFFGSQSCFNCKECWDRRKLIMPNIKITAEVDGKQVSLETVSTETFEAIKALEKLKKIPVARLATCGGSPRLLFKPRQNLHLLIGTVYALDLRCGDIGADWPLEVEDDWISQYKNIKPL